MPPSSFAQAARTGRPVGARPKPKPRTVAEFVTAALNNPVQPPPRPPKPPRTEGRYAGVWDDMNKEERSAYAKELASRRSAQNMGRHRSAHSTPWGWTRETAAVARAAARLEAQELVNKLKSSGAISAGDTEGEAATLAALTLVLSPGGMTKRRQMAKRLLRHYHADLAASLV